MAESVTISRASLEPLIRLCTPDQKAALLDAREALELSHALATRLPPWAYVGHPDDPFLSSLGGAVAETIHLMRTRGDG